MNNKTEYYITEDNPETHAFYISFDINDNNETIQDFDSWSEEVFDQIAYFALGKTKAQSIAIESTPRQAHRKGMNLLYKVKDIKESNDYYTSGKYTPDNERDMNRGEFGELILYYILEKILEKPQLIAKLYFKDSFNSVVHGFDAVHFDTNSNELWIGESKFYSDKGRAITELAKDLHSHFSVDFFNQEFTIISDRFSDLDINNEEIKKLIDPKTKFISKLNKINACFFALFDSKILEKFDFKGGSDEPAEEFNEELKQLIIKTRESFNSKISGIDVKERLKIHLFLFPVESKMELVRKLHLKLKMEGGF